MSSPVPPRCWTYDGASLSPTFSHASGGIQRHKYFTAVREGCHLRIRCAETVFHKQPAGYICLTEIIALADGSPTP
jgi:hypothetical protein